MNDRANYYSTVASFYHISEDNAQNTTRYNSVEKGKNTDRKRCNKMAGLNDPNLIEK